MTDDNATKRPSFIYALIDPRTDDIRYIGKTEDPKQRLRWHIWNGGRVSDMKRAWITALKDAGLEPTIRILEIVPGGVDWEEAERRHISIAKTAGANLTNGTDGGEGVPNSARGEKWRAALRASHVNNPRRVEGNKKAAEKNRGKKISPEHIAALTAATKGKPLSDSHRAALSVAAKNRGVSKEHMEMMNSRRGNSWGLMQGVSMRLKWADPEFREKCRAAQRAGWAKKRADRNSST